jgi:hypothetical protein
MANNHIKIFVYWYVVNIWKWVPILLTFECLIKGGISINIIIVILQVFITYGGLTNDQIIEHVIF